jgi:photosystem II stability/assembly factor-like uncharacterized protein
MLMLVLLTFVNQAFGASTKPVKLNSSVFGDIKARNIGPALMSGRITYIEGVPGKPNILYVGSAGGGVWKSEDRATTFEPVFDKHTMSIGCIAVDPNKTDTIWVGTGETNMRNSVSVGTGVYRSRDGGKRWKFMGLKDSERISKVIVKPGDSKTVYVAATGHLWSSNTERGVFKTSDDGKTWERVLYIDENTGCIDLEIDHKNPDVLLAAMWEFRRLPWFFTSGGKGSGMYKSVDGGKTWKKITSGLPEGELGRIAIAIAPADPKIAYAIVESKNTALYKSKDTGDTWEKAGDSGGVGRRPFYFANLLVDPKDSKRLYNPSYLLYSSKDGGESFGTVGTLTTNVHVDYHALWIDPENPEFLVVGNDGGVYKSFNQGKTFTFVTSLPVSQFYHISYDREIPYNVYGGLQDNGSWYGPSWDRNATAIMGRSWNRVGGGDGFFVLKDQSDQDTIYTTWQGGGLHRFNKRTGESATITPLPAENDPNYRFNWNAAVALSPTNKKTLYSGAQFLFKSLDQGRSWTRISPDLTTNDPEKQRQHKSGGITTDNTSAENHCTIIAVSESPLDENIIWVGTDDGNLQVTTNGGKKWTNVVKNITGLPPHTWCPTVEAGHFSKETAYVVFDGHRNGDKQPYAYKTDDMGKTWIPLADKNVKGYCHVLREDIVNRNLLFLGTEFGLYASFDGGENWVHFRETLPKVAVRDMCIQPDVHDLILGTHGRGIYILDDISPLRHLTEETFQQDLVILPARPSRTSLSSSGLVSPNGSTEYTGENPRDGAVITYYMKKRHIFGDLKMEILDPEGNVINSPGTRKRRGINRVYWGMRTSLPKAAKGAGAAQFIMGGPMVLPGTYTVRITKNKKVYTSKIEILPDRFTEHSLEDRRLRRQTMVSMIDRFGDLGYVGDTLRSIKTKLEKALDAKDKKINKRTRKWLRKKADFIKDTREKYMGNEWRGGSKLSEKMSRTYFLMMSYAGKPSKSQLDFIATFDKELAKARKDLDSILKKELPKINKKLKSLKIDEINVPTVAEYWGKDKK